MIQRPSVNSWATAMGLFCQLILVVQTIITYMPTYPALIMIIFHSFLVRSIIRTKTAPIELSFIAMMKHGNHVTRVSSSTATVATDQILSVDDYPMAVITQSVLLKFALTELIMMFVTIQ
jgi:hypothetical protein